MKKNFFARLFGHLSTVGKHRSLVRKHCFKLGLYRQGLMHDLSKYSFVEFWTGVKYYQEIKVLTLLKEWRITARVMPGFITRGEISIILSIG